MAPRTAMLNCASWRCMQLATTNVVGRRHRLLGRKGRLLALDHGQLRDRQDRRHCHHHLGLLCLWGRVRGEKKKTGSVGTFQRIQE
jgi:hypothetical protein